VNFNYFIDEEAFGYIVDAVHLVADEGSKLLPSYRFEPDSGLWHHAEATPTAPMDLNDISYSDGEMRYENRRQTGKPDLRALLDEARTLCDAASQRPATHIDPPQTTSDFEHLRWFPYPDDIERELAD
jgi:hypothetical protein